MSALIKGTNISDAWLNAIEHLRETGDEDYNLIVEIENPLEEDFTVRDRLNFLLSEKGDQSVETVANTIFPAALFKNGMSREASYRRFHDIYYKLKKIDSNRRGTYFGRLVGWKYLNTVNCGLNQIEVTIEKLVEYKQSTAGKRVRYEMSIYDPEIDRKTMMGFPCMSFISIKIRDKYLDLTSIYRNQYFFKKAYGNYLGLARLQEFICRESGFEVGTLTCIATHADIDGQVGQIKRVLELKSAQEVLLLD